MELLELGLKGFLHLNFAIPIGWSQSRFGRSPGGKGCDRFWVVIARVTVEGAECGFKIYLKA